MPETITLTVAELQELVFSQVIRCLGALGVEVAPEAIDGGRRRPARGRSSPAAERAATGPAGAPGSGRPVAWWSPLCCDRFPRRVWTTAPALASTRRPSGRPRLAELGLVTLDPQAPPVPPAPPIVPSPPASLGAEHGERPSHDPEVAMSEKLAPQQPVMREEPAPPALVIVTVFGPCMRPAAPIRPGRAVGNDRSPGRAARRSWAVLLEPPRQTAHAGEPPLVEAMDRTQARKREKVSAMGILSERKRRFEAKGITTVTLADIERMRQMVYYGPQGYFAKLGAAGEPDGIRRTLRAPGLQLVKTLVDPKARQVPTLKPAPKGVRPMLKKDAILEIIDDRPQRVPRFRILEVGGTLKVSYHCPACGTITTSTDGIERCRGCDRRP